MDIGIIQHGFTKGKSFLTYLINSYDEGTGLVNKGIAVDTFYLGFNMACDSVSHKIS